MKSKKLFLTSLILLTIPVVFSVEGVLALEVSYPEINNLQPAEDSPFLYVKYVISFIIWILGFIVFLALLIAGVSFISSAGDPVKLKKAKERLTSLFWGTILLLGSYIIIRTINPQFTTISPPNLQPLTDGDTLEAETITYEIDPLLRITDLAEKIKEEKGPLNDTLDNLYSQLEDCDCKYTLPMCVCQPYQVGGTTGYCTPQIGVCHAGPKHNKLKNFPTGPIIVPPPEDNEYPVNLCPEDEEIYKNQQEILAFRQRFLYYRQRVITEKNDIYEYKKSYLDPQIDNYETYFQNLDNLLNSGKELGVIGRKILEAQKYEVDIKKGYLENERNVKFSSSDSLYNKFEDLKDKLDSLASHLKNLSDKIDKCWENIPTTCRGICLGAGHDIRACHSGKCCWGGNPCPMREIENEKKAVKDQMVEIFNICEEIINKINQMQKTREFVF